MLTYKVSLKEGREGTQTTGDHACFAQVPASQHLDFGNVFRMATRSILNFPSACLESSVLIIEQSIITDSWWTSCSNSLPQPRLRQWPLSGILSGEEACVEGQQLVYRVGCPASLWGCHLCLEDGKGCLSFLVTAGVITAPPRRPARFNVSLGSLWLRASCLSLPGWRVLIIIYLNDSVKFSHTAALLALSISKGPAQMRNEQPGFYFH